MAIKLLQLWRNLMQNRDPFCVRGSHMTTWIDETLHDAFRFSLKAENVLVDDRSEHQHIVIFENDEFGRMLMLDGVVQLATRDEFIYHEMMAHVPLMALAEPKSVLVIGGGDGGVLREVLQHQSVETAILCEIDGSVIERAREYFPDVSAGAFDDPRSDVIVADGMAFTGETDERFDAVLVDSTDPLGPGAILFTPEFYANCRRCLSPGGVLVTQNGLPFVQGPELTKTIEAFRDLFADVWAYLATTPTYVGGPMSFGWGSDDAALRQISLAELDSRFESSKIATRYYRPDVHQGAFALPGYVRDLIV